MIRSQECSSSSFGETAGLTVGRLRQSASSWTAVFYYPLNFQPSIFLVKCSLEAIIPSSFTTRESPSSASLGIALVAGAREKPKRRALHGRLETSVETSDGPEVDGSVGGVRDWDERREPFL